MANNNIVPTAIVRLLLDDDNYDDWSIQVKTYLLAQDLWDVIYAPIPSEADNAWHKRNAAALHAIQISCSSDTFKVIRKIYWAKEAWYTLATNFSNNQPPRNEENDEYMQEYNRFFNNVGKGNWKATQEFIRLHPEAVRVTSPTFNRTALHLAVNFGHLHIVEELVNLMTPQDLEIKDNVYNLTAFHITTDKGNISMAKCMVDKNHNLLSIVTCHNLIPIVIAVLTNQKQMARYLYPLTVEQGVLFSDNGMHGAELMIECINNKMFVAKLADLSAFFPSGCQLKFWQQWIYNCMHAQFPQAINDLNIQNAEDNASNNRDITIRFGAVWSGLWQWMVSNFLKLPEFCFSSIW